MCRQPRIWDINLVIGRISILILTRPQVWIITCHPLLRPLPYKVGMHCVAVFDPLPYTITVNSTVGGNATIVQAPGPFYLFDNNLHPLFKCRVWLQSSRIGRALPILKACSPPQHHPSRALH